MKRKKILMGIAATIAVVILSFGGHTIYSVIRYETTDDAQLQGDVYPIAPKIPGYIAKVYVKENQPVHAGDLLVELDPHDFEIRVETEKAALASTQAGLEVVQAQIKQARAHLEQTAAQASRYGKLLKTREISQQQYDMAKAEADAAAAAHAAALQQAVVQQARIAEQQAELDAAEMNLSYTKISAPAGGIVGRKSIEPGQYVQTGQPLMAVVDNENLWVVANFKETQLRKMKIGQEVIVKVDSYSGHELRGRVDSISPATGARFALLPPDNASGNFVKVVQRVPVKIVLFDSPPESFNLAVGMSVETEVDLHSPGSVPAPASASAH